LWGLVLIVHRQKWGWLGVTLTVTALILSHNLTALMFLPLSLVFAISYAWVQRSIFPVTKQMVIELFGSYALAAGLSAFYLLPALVEKDATQINRILGGYFHYSQHFLYIRQLVTPFWGFGGSQWGPDDGISFFLGWGFLIGLIIAVAVVSWQGFRSLRGSWQKNWSRLILPTTVGGLASLSLFMTLQRASIIWDTVNPLAFIQFPWRWLSVGVLFGSLFMVLSLKLVTAKWWQSVVAVMVIAVLVSLNWSYFQPESYLDDPDSLYYTDPKRIQSSMSSILPDYIPIGMPANVVPPTALFAVPEGLETHIETIINKGHQKLLRTDLTSPITLNFNLADFPGWQVEVDGQPVEKLPGQSGTFAVEVPAGSHLVGAYFGSSPIRAVSDIVSLVSLMILFYLLLPSKFHSLTQQSAKKVHHD